ncbi:hypothetical protein WR25_22617 [Diploscapter pachys]|uniref:Uncharacterized protein n=1 Tax=Diploscapter pachys TaxID=2018661 RepID=A0A2A2K095_9BILA|nr:hypothetical protein WR25_22617 [Diploscapter pachys]
MKKGGRWSQRASPPRSTICYATRRSASNTRTDALAQPFDRLRECDVQFTHVRRQQGHAERRAVPLCQDRPEHSFEIVDVAIDRLPEPGVVVVQPCDIAGVTRFQHAHRTAGEDTAIALQIGGPGAVGHFGCKCLRDVDRCRVERFDQQGGAAGECVALRLFALGAGILQPRLDQRRLIEDLLDLRG